MRIFKSIMSSIFVLVALQLTAFAQQTCNLNTGSCLLSQIAGGGGSSGLLTQAIVGSSTTYTSGQNNYLIERSNSGSPMSDVLPGTVLPAQTTIVVVNSDPTGILSMKPSSGALFKNVTTPTGFLYLCPGQSASFYSDGTNYWVTGLDRRCAFGGDTLFYISNTGSASNDGLTASTPLADGTFAYNLVQNNFDRNGHKVTFSYAHGTYGQIVASGPLIGGAPGIGSRYSNPDEILFLGDPASPSSVLLTTANIFGTVYATHGAVIELNGFKVTNTNTLSAYDILAYQGSQIAFQNMEMGSVGAGMVQVSADYESTVSIIGPYTISAGGGCHWLTSVNSVIEVHNPGNTTTITLTGTPNFSQGFACAQYPSVIVIQNPVTFSGAATGPRYLAFLNGVITVGGNPNFFPGSSAGSVSTGGQYQ